MEVFENRQLESSGQIAMTGINVNGLSVTAPSGKPLLSRLSFSVPKGSFTAVIGLSGCGKSTLIRTLAGIQQPCEGSVSFAGHAAADIRENYPLAVGYLPQFGTFHLELTVREILQFAAALRLPSSVSRDTRHTWIQHIVTLSGITDLLDQRYSTLSGGQMRRVALAEELTSDPAFLLLDELTTGLDVFSDGEISLWLQNLSKNYNKTIVLVSHNVAHLEICDVVVVLNAGHLVYSGSYPSLLESQQVSSIEELFRKLATNSSQASPVVSDYKVDRPLVPQPLQTDSPPRGLQQIFPLLIRQAILFSRERAQIAIQICLIVTFPLLVAVFALNGLPQVRSLAGMEEGPNFIRSFQQKLLYTTSSIETAGLISGLVMFQVVLLTLIGANNGSREISKDRDILHKELFAGLSPLAYLGTKFIHVSFFSLIQSFWMTWFVKSVCGFPGDFLSQFSILFLTVLAMSTTCLAISAASASPERASLLGVYLVGFQLPLSGAALALPGWLSSLCQPFIAAYWGWSGYLRTLEGTPYFRVVEESTSTSISSYLSANMVLTTHIVVSLFMIYVFLLRLKKTA